MFLTIVDAIRGQDMFGYQLPIYFRGNERAYPTRTGGFLSLLVNMLIIW